MIEENDWTWLKCTLWRFRFWGIHCIALQALWMISIEYIVLLTHKDLCTDPLGRCSCQHVKQLRPNHSGWGTHSAKNSAKDKSAWYLSPSRKPFLNELLVALTSVHWFTRFHNLRERTRKDSAATDATVRVTVFSRYADPMWPMYTLYLPTCCFSSRLFQQ